MTEAVQSEVGGLVCVPQVFTKLVEIVFEQLRDDDQMFLCCVYVRWHDDDDDNDEARSHLVPLPNRWMEERKAVLDDHHSDKHHLLLLGPYLIIKVIMHAQEMMLIGIPCGLEMLQ